jgi:nitrite reductase/ring-hydroxylating ferredoxin subunit
LNKIEICSSDALAEGGAGYRFKVMLSDGESSAFVLRVNSAVRGYVNRCSHVPVELDWNYGQFLDDSGLYIVCATHGASYDGESGACMGGPCDGKPLKALNVSESDGKIFWQPEASVLPHPEGIEE